MQNAKCKMTKGFTLIEVVVAAGIFTFVAVMAIGIFAQMSRASDKVNADRETAQAARFAFEQLARSVRTASFLQVTQNGATTLSTPCPIDFIVPKVSASQPLCGNQLTTTLSSGGAPTQETFGIFQVTGATPAASYYCFARVPGATFTATKDSCITPPTVTIDITNPANFLISGYAGVAASDAGFNQKPYVKIRIVFQATQLPAGGATPKTYTYETTLVARNYDKQY